MNEYIKECYNCKEKAFHFHHIEMHHSLKVICDRCSKCNTETRRHVNLPVLGRIVLVKAG